MTQNVSGHDELVVEMAKNACDLFDAIVEFDAPRALLEKWLRLAAGLESAAADVPIERMADLKKRTAEARWMLAPASEALARPRMVEARDAAIDELRGPAGG